MAPKIKILTCYHKPAELIKSDIITPIHGGRALMNNSNFSEEEKEWMLNNTIGDDTGDNISQLNPYYCELDIIYWAWKNLDKLDNPDYIGLAHYRRMFDFDNKDPIHLVNVESTADYQNKYPNIDLDIQHALSEYDMIIPKLSGFPYGEENFTIKSHYNHYAQNYHNIIEGALDKTIDLLKSLYPDESTLIDNHFNSNLHSFYNMFIMKTEDFKGYCEWVFPILSTIHNSIDYSDASKEQKRTIGHLGERLLGYFITRLKAEKADLRIKDVAVALISNTNTLIPLKPTYPKNPYAIVFYISQQYVKYFAVTLQSLIDNSNPNHKYDIVLIHRENIDTNLLFSMVKNYPHITMRTCNISGLFSQFSKVNMGPEVSHISLDTYSRMFIPWIFPYYETVLSLDSDLILCVDPYSLFENKLDKNLLGAVVDSVVKLVCRDFKKFPSFYNNHFKKTDSSLYFNAGVLLWNIKEWTNSYSINQIIENIYSIEPVFADQDVLNVIAKNKVLYLDSVWNYAGNFPKLLENPQNATFYSETFVKGHLKIVPNIIHYLGSDKPWNTPNSNMAEKWWALARKTPFYEQIIYANTNINHNHNHISLRQLVKRILKIIIRPKWLRAILKKTYRACKKVFIK